MVGFLLNINKLTIFNKYVIILIINKMTMNFNNHQLNMGSWKPVYAIDCDCGTCEYFLFGQGDYCLR